MGIQADYVRKIQGLLATAESLAEQGNDEAAGAYVAKAHALQQKYSIDQAMLADADGGAGGAGPAGTIVDRTWTMPGAYGRRKVDLAHVVAVHTGCAGYFSRAESGGYRFTVFGFIADVEWAETLFFSLCHQAESALRHAEKAHHDHGRSFTTAFLAGFTHEVARRLREAAKEAERAAAREQATAAGGNPPRSVALVLAGKAKRVEEELKAKVGRLSTSRLSGSQSWSGFEQGRAAGRHAALARGSVDHGAAPVLPR
ncbi:MAG TPA: DUF2786 domain-containing protein [Acidimicrobiia bacterium]|nr:DUF2786 domain-containing protein [Acidimicrobiia bacterium]HZQ79571.1 DUF2786 domain-containing protein [Acidimicrobiia bacterium]